MPRSMRPPEIRLSVANRLAVTVMSRTAGLVTQGPSRMRLVLARHQRHQRIGLHPQHVRVKDPCVLEAGLLRLARQARMRSTVISGLKVIPNFMLFAPACGKQWPRIIA